MTDNVLTSAVEVAQRIQDGQLQGCMVQEVDLSADGLANARGVDVTFRRVGLHDADATRAQLSRAKFMEASCRGVRFDNALLRDTAFLNSELIEARFATASLTGCTFYSTRLGNADFSGSRIQSSTFNSCELFGARFTRSLIIKSKFEAAERGNVTLDRANFAHAVLIDCDLMGANLFGADFSNALLIKVDLRHANIAQANFEGARLIDVQVDLSQMEPGEKRMIERAKFDDPWRNHGFMAEVLAPYSDDEMHRMLEYVLRTYIIEAGEEKVEADSFATLLQSMKARHDFEELENLRVRNGIVQVRFGFDWYDLGGNLPAGAGGGGGGGGGESPAPAPATAQPASGGGAPEQSGGGRGRRSMFEEPVEQPREKKPPKKVGTSKRFKKLDLD